MSHRLNRCGRELAASYDEIVELSERLHRENAGILSRFSPDDLNRKTFTTRPRTEGLWVRLRFKDNDVMEGMMANDLTQVSPDGFLINPPDTRSNTQRIYVPRSALLGLMRSPAWIWPGRMRT